MERMIHLPRIFDNPFEDGYLALTTRIPITGPECTSFSSITDGTQTVTFSSPLERHDVPGVTCRWCAWSGPPEGEEANPPVLFSFGTTLTMTLSNPSRIFGFELMPNLQTPPETHSVRVDFFSGANLIQSITRTLTLTCDPGNGGSRLFSVQVDEPDGPCIDNVVITVLTPQPAQGFSIAQIRYAECCDTCLPLCTDREISFTATFSTGVPFTLTAVGTPEFNGNLNDNVECTTGTCLQTVMFTICDTTLECCITLGTINFSGTADLLISLPALLETDCGSEVVTLFDNVTVPISQTCFTCLGEEECPTDICGLLEPITDTFTANIISATQVEVSGTLLFHCP